MVGMKRVLHLEMSEMSDQTRKSRGGWRNCGLGIMRGLLQIFRLFSSHPSNAILIDRRGSKGAFGKTQCKQTG